MDLVTKTVVMSALDVCIVSLYTPGSLEIRPSKYIYATPLLHTLLQISVILIMLLQRRTGPFCPVCCCIVLLHY